MRVAATIAAVVLLSACDSAQVSDCEGQLKAKLKAPASYKRVSVSEFLNDTYKLPYYEVTIMYDAVNSFNAPIRDKATCFYKPATTERIDPFGFNTADELPASDLIESDMNATDMNATAMSAAKDTARDPVKPRDDAAAATPPAHLDVNSDDPATDAYPQNDAGE